MFSKRGICLLAAFSMPISIGSGAATGGAQHNIEYAQVGGVPLYMDADIPKGPGPFPAAIIVHGGGWVRGDRRTNVTPLFRPLSNAGIAWFSIDYRLAGGISQFGAAVEDVKSAVQYLKAHATDYGIDSDRIALIGESAGGQLAAMAALEPAPGGQVKAVVALYAPTDLVDLAKTSNYVPRQLRDSIHGTAFGELVLARLGQLSPLHNVKSDAPPFLLIHGTADHLVPFSQSRAMCERLKAAGASCELYPIQGGEHGMRWWEASRPREADAYKREIVRWLNAQWTHREAA